MLTSGEAEGRTARQRSAGHRLPYAGRFLNEIMRLNAVPVIMRRALALLDLAGHGCTTDAGDKPDEGVKLG